MEGIYVPPLEMTADSSKFMKTEKMAIGQREERVACRFSGKTLVSQEVTWPTSF